MPRAPRKCLAAPAMGKISETAILRSIMDYLAARHVLAFRMNSGASFQQNADGRKRFMRFGVPGMADILAFRVHVRGIDDNGAWCSFTEITPVWIEVKTATGKQGELQKSFQDQVEREGHRYGICRSIDDVEKLLK